MQLATDVAVEILIADDEGHEVFKLLFLKN
jgi:hypothetical protein